MSRISILFFIFLSSYLMQLRAQKHETLSVEIVIKDQAILNSNNIIKQFVTVDSTGFGTPQLLTRKINIFNLKAPNFFVFSNESRTPYFIKPNEVINVKLINKNSLLFYIEGNEIRSNELDFFRKLIERYGALYSFLPDKSKHPKLKTIDSIGEMTRVMKNINSKRYHFLDSFFNKKLVSKEFYLVAKNILQASLINNTQILVWNNRDLLMKLGQYDSITNNLFHEVLKIPFSPYFIFFQINRAAISMVMTKYLDYEIRDSLNFRKRLEFVNKEYNDLAKDFMLTNTIKSALYHSFPISVKEIDYFFKQCKDQGCKKIIRDLLYNKSKQNAITSSNALLSSDTLNVSDLSKILLNQKSEFIFLDFWASWCGPCREAMPESEMLRKNFEKQGIQFIYLSLDDDISSWHTAHKFENLPDSTSFLLLQGLQSNIVKENKISFIPRYMLVTNTGILLNNDLPHIGDPRLVEFLKKVISSKKL